MDVTHWQLDAVVVKELNNMIIEVLEALNNASGPDANVVITEKLDLFKVQSAINNHVRLFVA